ncbi:MAG: hypothetical protein A2931_02220 [Candidatus Niyogibacteria bacterium RIFCSPLOWO2_01_FULL_45_48]|uniref:Uncharacterized protein n=2 Tax=Candidatus Niyogiibacteriota TaxID=1817912 RepID=A0A1G2EZ21_9BACT|nr:MAG: hypothetical protein A3J00_03900 [Candidatus Niyogibacteria bacterium RIFCSPLOWO2_02_FULL_45_13]OGZ31280.1 MAG: hypothetical protein A2931_02220 [Candidatus Niyogibacteria bacterium RIFCSPLOWO2_01_FULL_45_48]
MTPEELLFSLYSRRAEIEAEAIKRYQMGIGLPYTDELREIDEQIKEISKRIPQPPFITESDLTTANEEKIDVLKKEIYTLEFELKSLEYDEKRAIEKCSEQMSGRGITKEGAKAHYNPIRKEYGLKKLAVSERLDKAKFQYNILCLKVKPSEKLATHPTPDKDKLEGKTKVNEQAEFGVKNGDELVGYSEDNLRKFLEIIKIIFNQIELDGWSKLSRMVKIPFTTLERGGFAYTEMGSIFRSINKINNYKFVVILNEKPYEELKNKSTYILAGDIFGGSSDFEKRAEERKKKETLRKWLSGEGRLIDVSEYDLENKLVLRLSIGAKQDPFVLLNKWREDIEKKLNQTKKSERETATPTKSAEEVETGRKIKPYTEARGSKGYFKFYKQGELIDIGSVSSRHFRLLEALCSPHFGVHKTIDAVFEAIRLLKDKNDTNLINYGTQKQRKLDIVGYTKKELQKNKKLKGEIKYKLDDRKQNIWLELEG